MHKIPHHILPYINSQGHVTLGNNIQNRFFTKQIIFGLLPKVVFCILKTLVKRGHNITFCTFDMSNLKTKITLKTNFADFKISR